jgi:uncharacterized protein
VRRLVRSATRWIGIVDIGGDFAVATSFVPSRYTSFTPLDDGSLVLHNTLTGAMGVVPPEQVTEARSALRRAARHAPPSAGILNDLVEGGFLIGDDVDERAVAHDQYLVKYSDDFLRLTLLPTEHCNFRCVYCSQSFLRGKMPANVQDGIRQYVAKQKNLRRLQVDWYGGEPLVAADVVLDLARYFLDYSQEHGIQYVSGMTTNGSLLDLSVARQLIDLGVKHFQITIDGIGAEHNKRRIGADGSDTFDAVMDNLRQLKKSNLGFFVHIRHNFDVESLPQVEEFIGFLSRELQGDERFIMAFEPIERWGGPNDESLPVCEGRLAVDAILYAKSLAIEAGFRAGRHLERMQPNGCVCYAANPRAFVIGSDGTVYKCTQELDYHDRNRVGQLRDDGSMDLDMKKFGLWVETNGMEEGMKCYSCQFSPACHGAWCPKQWMDDGDCSCPIEKVARRQIIPLILKENELAVVNANLADTFLPD